MEFYMLSIQKKNTALWVMRMPATLISLWYIVCMCGNVTLYPTNMYNYCSVKSLKIKKMQEVAFDK